MAIGAIIQARLDSKRLPYKVLREIRQGYTMLDLVLYEAKRTSMLDKVCLTTPDLAVYALGRYVRKACSHIWRGPRNPLAEYHAIAKQHAFDLVVRLTADCPLLTGEIIDAAISEFLACGAAYGYNETDGADVEVFTFAALDEAYRRAGPDEREHVTTYIRRHFVCATLRAPPGEFVSVDTPDDYEKVCELIREREAGKVGSQWAHIQAGTGPAGMTQKR